MKGLSRMRGNSHVRFLGEGLAVMPSSYPIMESAPCILHAPPHNIAIIDKGKDEEKI